jgi:hypothetical protein
MYGTIYTLYSTVSVLKALRYLIYCPQFINPDLGAKNLLPSAFPVSAGRRINATQQQCCGSGSESGSGSTCFWASRILLSSCKNSKKNLDSSYFVTLFEFLSWKNDVNVASKSHKQKKLC